MEEVQAGFLLPVEGGRERECRHNCRHGPSTVKMIGYFVKVELTRRVITGEKRGASGGSTPLCRG